MKRLLSPIVSLLLFMGLVPANANWTPSPAPSEEAHWGILGGGITESYAKFANPNLMSFSADSYKIGVGTVLSVALCETYPSEKCPTSQFQKYQAPLGMCVDYKTDCIEEVVAEVNGRKLNVIFDRYFPLPRKESFKGAKEYNLPSSGSTFLVRIPEAAHEKGSSYLISAVVDGLRMPDQAKFITNSLEIAIWPVELINGNFPMYEQATDPARYSALGINSGANSTNCSGVQTNGTECAMPVFAPTDLEIGLSLRLSTQVGGWLHGRMSDVDAGISTNAASEQLLSVKGKSVTVPVIHGWVKKSEAPAGLKNFYDSMDPFYLNMGEGYGCKNPASRGGPCGPQDWISVLRSPSNSAAGMTELTHWLQIVQDRSASQVSTWTMRTINGDITGSCKSPSDKLVGIVSTNATTYLPGPPTFNATEGSLDYKVLAPHFLNDGSEFKGTYDLVMRTDIARCVYGFSNAPIKASVSIVSEEGVNQVAATTISESGGLLRLGAYGFTFSAPTLRVKLSQETESVVKTETKATPEPAQEVETPKKNKKFITCVRGSVTKKVATKAKKCPQGYKRA